MRWLRVTACFPAGRASLAAALIILPACRGQEAVPTPSRDELRKLMQGNAQQPAPAPFRLAALVPADIPPGPACRLSRGSETLLVSGNGAALAKVDGRLQRIPQAGPVDASGGFFRASGVTISIGRRDPTAPLPAPAGVTVAGRGDDPPQKIEASWSCAG